MAIKSVRVANFRSFDDFELNLGQFNVVVGANASGKSNLLQVFKFLEDIADHGLKDAISLQGGVDFLTNAQIGRSRPLSVTVTADADDRLVLRTENEDPAETGPTGVGIRAVSYHFSLNFSKDEEVSIISDRLTLKCVFFELEKGAREDSLQEQRVLGHGTIVLSNANGEPRCTLDIPEDVPLTKRDLLPPTWMIREEASQPSLLLEKHFYHLPIFLLPAWEILGVGVAIYDFDSRQPKRAAEITGKSELEEDGRNLALVLRKIIDDDDKHRRFCNLVQDILPFVEDLDVDTFADKSLLMTLEESYAPAKSFPASFISDGTINIIALIVALYFEEHSVVMIEEPERNIHPYLISRVVEMLKDKAEKKQVLVTTHNPEVVEHAGLENILLISRHEDGFSRVSRPSEKEAVDIFLKNELGVGELYKHNLLEG